MKGIHYIVDDKGQAESVVIDLKEWGDLWEDFYDNLVAESRKEESDSSWEEVKQRLDALRRQN